MNLLAIGALPVALGASALAIDLGALYLATRTLQGAADAAALAAARSADAPEAAAEAALTDAQLGDARVVLVENGGYLRDAAVPVDTRFRPGIGAGAARVSLEQRVPLFFGRLLTGNASDVVTARATAARIDLAAFAIGSRLAGVEGGIANAVLSALAGTELDLSVMDYQALVGAEIDILAFSDALRSELDMEAATFGETLAADATLPQAMRALAASTSGEPAAIFNRIAARVPGQSVRFERLIDLGPYASAELTGGATAPAVDGASLLRAVLETANGTRQVSADLGAALPGLGTTRITIAIGERPAQSPWLTITEAQGAVVRTAQARILLETRVAAGGLGQLNLPVAVELASAEARLDAIDCAAGTAGGSATLAVTPSVGRLMLGTVDPMHFGNFGSPLALSDATLLHLPLLRVRALGDVRLGGAQAHSVSFSRADIAAGTIKPVATGDFAQASIGSLVTATDIDVTVAGLGLNLSAVTAAVGGALTAAAPAIDAAVGSVSDLIGLRLGEADVRVLAMRCGTPMLVG